MMDSYILLGFLWIKHQKKHILVGVSLHYRKVPKFSDTRKLCCNLLKIQTKRPILRIFLEKDANGIANSEDPDQTALLGAV